MFTLPKTSYTYLVITNLSSSPMFTLPKASYTYPVVVQFSAYTGILFVFMLKFKIRKSRKVDRRQGWKGATFGIPKRSESDARA